MLFVGKLVLVAVGFRKCNFGDRNGLSSKHGFVQNSGTVHKYAVTLEDAAVRRDQENVAGYKLKIKASKLLE